jgi:hypothetical protein
MLLKNNEVFSFYFPNNRQNTMKSFFSICLIMWGLCPNTFAQNANALFSEKQVSITINDYTLYGSLVVPTQKVKKMPVALFIAGSGPTDRNGNNTAGLNTYAYQKFCHSLAEKGIATLRFDKWETGESKPQNTKEAADNLASIRMIKRSFKVGNLTQSGMVFCFDVLVSLGTLFFALTVINLKKNVYEKKKYYTSFMGNGCLLAAFCKHIFIQSFLAKCLVYQAIA